jgi:flagellar hook-length control protein FliK
MKLAELLQGPKPTPSPLPRGGAWGEASDGKTSDFADALNEARRKPETKAAEPEKPVAKKQSAGRKGKAAPADEQPADEAVAADETRPVDKENPAAAGDELDVEDDQSPIVEDEFEAPVESEPDEVVADATAMALAQVAIPQTPVVSDEQPAHGEFEDASSQPQMISPPKLNQPARPAAASTEDAESETDAVVTSGVSGMLLEGMDEAADFEGEPLPEELDLDAAPAGEPVAKAPLKSHATAASVKPVEASDPTAAPERESKDVNDAQDALSPNQFAMEAGTTVGEEPVAPTSHTVADTSAPTAAGSVHMQPETAKPQAAPQSPVAQAPPPPPQAHFVETNHPKIVSAVQAQALTNGGTMQIRLDPPELGALQVMVHMQDGVMTASFHTSNDDATKLLSHSLSQLKQVLESQGVSVERLQVQQAPKDQHAQNDDPHQQDQRDQHGDAHRQEQQRKEMLRRMWRRLSNGSDPLDLVA